MSIDARFPQREGLWPLNMNGYGEANPWIPPLAEPKTLLGMIDRHLVVGHNSNPIDYFLVTSLTLWLFPATGDANDGYWYSNAETAGQQLYPKGLYKYYDMSSWDGLIKYAIDWYVVYLTDFWSFVTFGVPVDIILYIFEGYNMDNIVDYFIWYYPWFFGLNQLVGGILGIKVEDGFPMLWY
jgi:hypothetical protein